MYPNEATDDDAGEDGLGLESAPNDGESEKRGKSSTLMLTYRLMRKEQMKQVGGWEEKRVFTFISVDNSVAGKEKSPP